MSSPRSRSTSTATRTSWGARSTAAASGYTWTGAPSPNPNPNQVYSDWRTHGDGFGRMLVHGMPDDDAPNQRTAAGKALQRLLDG